MYVACVTEFVFKTEDSEKANRTERFSILYDLLTHFPMTSLLNFKGYVSQPNYEKKNLAVFERLT